MKWDRNAYGERRGTVRIFRTQPQITAVRYLKLAVKCGFQWTRPRKPPADLATMDMQGITVEVPNLAIRVAEALLTAEITKSSHQPGADVTRQKLLPICVVQLDARFDFTAMLVVEPALGIWCRFGPATRV